MVRSKKHLHPVARAEMRNGSMTSLADDLDYPVRARIDQDDLIVDHGIAITANRRHIDGLRQRIKLDRFGDFYADARSKLRRRSDRDPLARDSTDRPWCAGRD